MSAAKDKRAGPVEGLEDGESLRRSGCERKCRGGEQKEKEREGGERCSAWKRDGERGRVTRDGSAQATIPSAAPQAMAINWLKG